MDTCIMDIISLILSIAALIISAYSLWYKKKQYQSGIRPELWTNGRSVIEFKNHVEFDIKNRSDNTAIITDVIPQGKNILLYQPFKRYELTNDEETDGLKVRCVYHGNDIHKDTYKLKIKYEDKEGNEYTAYLHVNKNGNYIANR